MGLRGCAAIYFCDASFSGYAGYWFLSIEKAVLFVCDAFTLIEGEMPLRDLRVWESFIPFNDRDGVFEVQIIDHHHPGYTNNLMAPFKLDCELPPSVSKKFGLTVADEMLTEESKIMGTAWRHRNETTGLTKPDFSGQPIFATRPPAELKLPPLRFPGDDGADTSAEQEEEQEE
jgi:hypothetical protein